MREKRYPCPCLPLNLRLINSEPLQVTHHVSSLVSEGEDAAALSAIDKPLKVLLEGFAPKSPLLSYVDVQYEDNKTLMDVDTAFLISVIDAIRYK